MHLETCWKNQGRIPKSVSQQLQRLQQLPSCTIQITHLYLFYKVVDKVSELSRKTNRLQYRKFWIRSQDTTVRINDFLCKVDEILQHCRRSSIATSKRYFNAKLAAFYGKIDRVLYLKVDEVLLQSRQDSIAKLMEFQSKANASSRAKLMRVLEQSRRNCIAKSTEFCYNNKLDVL